MGAWLVIKGFDLDAVKKLDEAARAHALLERGEYAGKVVLVT